MMEMNTERWERVQSIFAQTADLPEQDRRSFVEALCDGDEQMSASVLEMLEEDGREQALLDGDLGSVIGEVADSALHSDHFRSLVERQIGPYRLLSVLGEGGMGIVYLAERTGIGGLVAIKLLRDAWLSPMRRERFALEQETLVKLNHPAIARLYDASTMEDGTPWFVMEYADGLPLTDYLRARAASVREDLMLFRSVCEAVQYAHGLAIIHRDLKPSNIFVTKEGEVKLLDFGIAKQMNAETATGDRTNGRTIAGLRLLTPGYAAPEQYTGAEVGVFTDVYSLGVVLYEILTGSLVESADTRRDKKIEKPSAVARRAGGVAGLSKQQWADLDLICVTALEVETQRRYRSVDALVRDVTAYLDGRVLGARPPSFSYTAGKFMRRNRLALSSVAAGVIVLAGAATFFTVRLAHARDAAVAEAARTTRIQHFMLDMLGNGDEEAGPSNDLKVTTLLDREADHAASLDADLPTQVDLYQTVGTMYNRMGKFDKSNQMLSEALKKAQQSAGVKSLKVAELLVQLGMLHGDLGDVKTGQQEIQRALDIADRNHLGAQDPILIQANIGMGRLTLNGGDAEKAIEILAPIAALNWRKLGTNPEDVRDSLALLSSAELGAQHYDLAEATSRKVIDLDRQLLGESHLQTGIDIVNLASILFTKGDLQEADRLYREGIGIMRTWYGTDNPDIATAMSLLAKILVAEKKDAEARPLLEDALSVQERTYGSTHERIAFTVSSLGEIASRQHDFATAETYFNRAFAVYRSLYGDSTYRTAMAECNLGNIYLKESRFELAESMLRKAVAVLAQLPPGNNLIGVTRGRWGRSLLALKRYPEAETQLTAADELLKAQRNPPATEVSNVRSDLAMLYLAIHQPDRAKGYKSEVPAINQMAAK